MMKPLVGALQRQDLLEEDEELQMKAVPAALQREEMLEEEEELMMKPRVQRMVRCRWRAC